VGRTVKIVFVALVLAMSWSVSTAQQRYRGPRQVIKGGMMQKPDTLKRDSLPRQLQIDSAMIAKMVDSLDISSVKVDSMIVDSLSRAGVPDSLRHRAAVVESLRRNMPDSLRVRFGKMGADSLQQDSLRAKLQQDTLATDSLKKKKRKLKPLLTDSMSLSGVCWAAAVLPGYGQIYNKQYWKLPILYSTVGAGLGMFIYENSRYQPLKRQYEAMTNKGLSRTPELDHLQRNMQRSNTRRLVYLGLTIGSYLYFIGDAAVKYHTNEVSSVKRATTLSVICPGAGQIYNKSYWRVPIVLGGFATTIYCIDWNNRGFQRFKKAYSLKADYDKNPGKYPSGSTDEFGGRYSATFLKNLRDSYRRNRDLCIILTAGLYVLQIIDAHVDAHLRDYDISGDLSMNVTPIIDYSYSPLAGGVRPTFGMNMGIKF
jgi:hypothetical protein